MEKILICTPEEAKIVGVNASMVLNQIRYWLFKTKKGKNYSVVVRGGERWLAHSWDQLAAETCLSRKQIRTSLAALQLHGFIIVEQHLHYGKNVCHFRAAKVGRLIQTGQVKSVPSGSPSVNPADQPETTPQGQLLKLETTFETKKGDGALSAQAFADQLIQGKKEKKEKKEKESKKLGAVAAEGAVGAHAALTASDLGAVFRDAWDEACPGEFLPEFTNKDLGQFANLIEKCPPNTALAVVDHSVRRWNCFCSYACGTQGAFNLPSQPAVGALLRFVQSAVNLYQDHVIQAAKPQLPKKLPPQLQKLEPPASEKETDLAVIGKLLGMSPALDECAAESF